MRPGFKTLKKFRDSPSGSHALASVLGPVARACGRASQRIREVVRYNGGAVEYDGVTLVFPENVGMVYSSLIFWDGTGGYEPTTWRVLKHFILRAGHFVDIGSNVGLYAVLARKIRPELVIDAFEPIPAIHAHNVEFHKSNGADSGFVHRIACGDRDGEAVMFLPAMGDENEDEPTATLRADSWQSHKAARKEVPVPTMRLDTFMADKVRPLPMFIKMDVEDFEAGVLRGAHEVFSRLRPVMVCEILPREHGNQETVSLLRALDYEFFGICREGVHRMTGADFFAPRPFTDFLCVPSASVPRDRNFLPYGELGRISFGESK